MTAASMPASAEVDLSPALRDFQRKCKALPKPKDTFYDVDANGVVIRFFEHFAAEVKN